MIEVELIVVSDRASAGERADQTADKLRHVLEERGFALMDVHITPDDRHNIRTLIEVCADRVPLVLTTGGTGVSKRDLTPEATHDAIEFEIPGLAEEMRRRSVEKTIHALGSRALAGALGETLVINLPGSPKGAVECFGFVAAALPHLIAQLRGPVADKSHEPPRT